MYFCNQMKAVLLHICSLVALIAAWFPMRVCAQNTEKQTAADICQEANAYYDREQYALAMTRYIDGMEAAEKEQDMQTYMVCTGCVANIYEAIGDYDADIIYLFKDMMWR